MTRSGLEGFGRSLGKEDEVVIEVTGNAMAVVRVLSPYVARVIVANPLQVKAIAHAHVKTDKIDAGVLASLRAADFLPEVWLPDSDTERRRRLVARRNQVVRHRTRIKNEVHAILHAHLIPPCPHADLFGRLGRIWLAQQLMPDDEGAAIERHLRELDRLSEDLGVLDTQIAQAGSDDPAVKRLLTITSCQSDRRRRSRGGNRRWLHQSAETGQLCRPEPAGAAIRSRGCPAWSHQQARAFSCPCHAGRGSLGCGQSARPAARLLFAHPRPS